MNVTMDMFMARVRRDPSGCWLWTGHVGRDGYARFRVDGRPALVHRYAYEQYVGPIGPGLEVDHTCRVRHCVRPGHLEAVTPRENMRRSTWNLDVRGVCKRGHVLNKDTIQVLNDGRRQCRPCAIEARRERVRRRRESAA